MPGVAMLGIAAQGVAGAIAGRSTVTPEDTRVSRLGPGRFNLPRNDSDARCVDDSERVLVSAETRHIQEAVGRGEMPPAFLLAGPRRKLFFQPSAVRAGIVTCGGLCPGLNNVIRALVLTLWHQYDLRELYGFRFGYEGLTGAGEEPMMLDPRVVADIHESGGTILGSSRGPQDLDEMIEQLLDHQIRILFTIGGDGTLRGASALSERLRQLGHDIAVVGVPKTIDNDIQWVVRSFGVTTAVHAANEALHAANTEAESARNGVGLVKLMGRHSGFIAANATLANAHVNFCLVPEVATPIDGPGGLLQALEKRLDARGHALIAVAEGFGQELFAAGAATDASGNRKLGDVGAWLRDRINSHFDGSSRSVTVKYIDPSYIIRSIPATSFDAELCLAMGQYAAHAGMAGFTDLMIGYWNRCYTLVPIPLAVKGRRKIDPEGALWQHVLETTGQDSLLGTA